MEVQKLALKFWKFARAHKRRDYRSSALTDREMLSMVVSCIQWLRVFHARYKPFPVFLVTHLMVLGFLRVFWLFVNAIKPNFVVNTIFFLGFWKSNYLGYQISSRMPKVTRFNFVSLCYFFYAYILYGIY